MDNKVAISEPWDFFCKLLYLKKGEEIKADIFTAHIWRTAFYLLNFEFWAAAEKLVVLNAKAGEISGKAHARWVKMQASLP